MALVHLVASVRGMQRPFDDWEESRWVWERLAAAVPEALACCVMPEHTHLIADEEWRAALSRVLGASSRRHGARFETLEPAPLRSPAITARAVRYVLLNPVREGLVTDPFAWEFSTLRDLADATWPGWVDTERLSKAVAIRPQHLLEFMTRSQDRRTKALVDDRPVVAAREAVLESVAAVLHIDPCEVLNCAVGTTLVVQTVEAIGLTSCAAIEAAFAIPARSVRRKRSPPHPALPAVIRCLSDARLRHRAWRRGPAFGKCTG